VATYTQIVYQVIFSARNREAVFTSRDDRLRMYGYMAGLIRNKKCKVYEINGVEDHFHLAFLLHPDIALSRLVKDLKLATSSWIKDEDLFPAFENWKRGYSAFTYTAEAIPNLKGYIENQEERHRKEDSTSELKRLLDTHQIEIDEKYFE